MNKKSAVIELDARRCRKPLVMTFVVLVVSLAGTVLQVWLGRTVPAVLFAFFAGVDAVMFAYWVHIYRRF